MIHLKTCSSDMLQPSWRHPLGETPQQTRSHQKHLPLQKNWNSTSLFCGKGKGGGECQDFFVKQIVTCNFLCLQQKINSSCFFLFSFVFVPGQSSQEKTTFPRPPSARPPEICSFPLPPQNFTLFFSLSCLVAWILPPAACKNRFNLCKATGLSPSPNSVMANSLKLTLAKLGF